MDKSNVKIKIDCDFKIEATVFINGVAQISYIGFPFEVFYALDGYRQLAKEKFETSNVQIKIKQKLTG